MYLEPLLGLLDELNTNGGSDPVGVFSSQPWQSLVLVLDFKNAASDNYIAVLDEMLQPFKDRHYLTYANGTERKEGPLTIVAGGSKPKGLIAADDDRRHVFYNVHSLPTDRFPDGHADGTFCVSLSFRRLVGTVYGRLSEAQLQRVRGHIHAAHDLGLSIRIWGQPKYAWRIDVRAGVQRLMDKATNMLGVNRWLISPEYVAWPEKRYITEYIWDVLAKEGVDWIDVDDMQRVQRWVHDEHGDEDDGHDLLRS